MKKIVFVSILFGVVQSALAALPPQYQNTKDLDVMVGYIESHPEVASTLESIDFLKYTVNFGDGCKAVFGRKATTKPPGWVGPADPLEFKESTCSQK